eukprot:CAMPEP_0204181794 /NCGR_PEP_ID=MMETSP0361-20130328/52225_1 /ASSEMBLY_ACC=CAM_ASM_000343 /TAXON_ID=268821 /ORGANISM="Scrippsiella Hangoei, Strain SHTV-5" /LENGTH=133 /DNA_ID=CAMNT_0051141423 /DNA_START=105 /DNA_END=503 /DNA_ORIENTATION=+
MSPGGSASLSDDVRGEVTPAIAAGEGQKPIVQTRRVAVHPVENAEVIVRADANMQLVVAGLHELEPQGLLFAHRASTVGVGVRDQHGCAAESARDAVAKLREVVGRARGDGGVEFRRLGGEHPCAHATHRHAR